MPDLIYPTSTSIRRPILITAAALKELDELLAKQLPPLLEVQKELIPIKVEERAQAFLSGLTEERREVRRKEYTADIEKELFARNSTSVSIHFSDGSALEARSFEEASAHPETLRKIATSFALEIECGDVSAILQSGTWRGDGLTLEVKPNNYQPAAKFFSSLSRWVRMVEAPKWQQRWNSVVIAPFVVWMVWVWLAFAVFGTSQIAADSDFYKEQGRKLVQEGITADNQSKALETILALNTDYPAPASFQHAISHWFWFFLVTGTIAAAVLAYPPRLEIGIGRGESRVRRWQKWMSFVFIIVPAFIFSNVLWPIVSEIVKKYALR